MEVEDSEIYKYVLVDWNRPHGHERLNEKPLFMTKAEAHQLNNSLLLNKQSKRYIKSEL